MEEYETIAGSELTESFLAGQICQAVEDDYENLTINPEGRGFFLTQSVSYAEDEVYFVSVRRVPQPD